MNDVIARLLAAFPGSVIVDPVELRATPSPPPRVDPAPADPFASCGHSLASSWPDGVVRCAYCGAALEEDP